MILKRVNGGRAPDWWTLAVCVPSVSLPGQADWHRQGQGTRRRDKYELLILNFKWWNAVLFYFYGTPRLNTLRCPTEFNKAGGLTRIYTDRTMQGQCFVSFADLKRECGFLFFDPCHPRLSVSEFIFWDTDWRGFARIKVILTGHRPTQKDTDNSWFTSWKNYKFGTRIYADLHG